MNSTLTTVAGEGLWADINLHGPGGVRMCQDGGIRRPVDYVDSTYRRGEFLRKFSYAVPTPEAIQAIDDFCAGDSVVEIGAGRALWAYLLQLAGVDVVPTDMWRPKDSGYDVFKESNHTWTDICLIDAPLAVLRPCGCLMVIWPPYGHSMAMKAIAAFRGNKVIYVGEQYGCTANDDFHRALDAEWIEQAVVAIPQWWGINDAVYFYVRKTKT